MNRHPHSAKRIGWAIATPFVWVFGSIFAILASLLVIGLGTILYLVFPETAKLDGGPH